MKLLNWIAEWADDLEELIADTRDAAALRPLAADPLLDELAELRERLAEECHEVERVRRIPPWAEDRAP